MNSSARIDPNAEPGEVGKINPDVLPELEELLGNWKAGRYAWLLRDCRRLISPLPWRGQQGFQMPTLQLELAVRQQIEGALSC